MLCLGCEGGQEDGLLGGAVDALVQDLRLDLDKYLKLLFLNKFGGKMAHFDLSEEQPERDVLNDLLGDVLGKVLELESEAQGALALDLDWQKCKNEFPTILLLIYFFKPSAC